MQDRGNNNGRFATPTQRFRTREPFGVSHGVRQKLTIEKEIIEKTIDSTLNKA